jgi:hypothetical protein
MRRAQVWQAAARSGTGTQGLSSVRVPSAACPVFKSLPGMGDLESCMAVLCSLVASLVPPD